MDRAPRFFYAWILFIIIFTFVNARVSARFAYNSADAGLWDYFIGLWCCLAALLIGLAVGSITVGKIGNHNDLINRNIITLIIAIILEIGLNAWNVLFHI